MQTPKPIHISNTLWDRADKESKNANRTPDEQVEHWAQIGAVAEDNPDLPLEFIRQILVSREEIKRGEIELYSPKP